jgi:uncharacterized protein HemX
MKLKDNKNTIIAFLVVVIIALAAYIVIPRLQYNSMANKVEALTARYEDATTDAERQAAADELKRFAESSSKIKASSASAARGTRQLSEAQCDFYANMVEVMDERGDSFGASYINFYQDKMESGGCSRFGY